MQIKIHSDRWMCVYWFIIPSLVARLRSLVSLINNSIIYSRYIMQGTNEIWRRIPDIFPISMYWRDRWNDENPDDGSNAFSRPVDLVSALRLQTPNPNGIKGSRDLDQMNGSGVKISSSCYILSPSIHILYRRIDGKQIPNGFGHSRRGTYAPPDAASEWHTCSISRKEKIKEKMEKYTGET